LTKRYEVKEMLVASKPISFEVKCFVSTPLVEKNIGVTTPNNAGIQVAIAGSVEVTTYSSTSTSSFFIITPERLITTVQITMATVPITW
jgi:hypothetical protein